MRGHAATESGGPQALQVVGHTERHLWAEPSLNIGFEREGRARTRMIRITMTGQLVAPETRGAKPSASSAPSADPVKANTGNGFGNRDLRTVGDPADGSRGENTATVRANPLKTGIETDADGADVIHLPRSAPENVGWRSRL